MWYFTDAEEKLRYDDGRKISLGKTHGVKCEPILCKQGLHASPTVLDAVGYAPGNILYRVELSGTIVHGYDKSCATERTYLARIDAEPILRAFARRVALDVVHLWVVARVVARDAAMAAKFTEYKALLDMMVTEAMAANPQ